MSFIEIPCKELNFNPFSTVADEWMLLASGNEKDGYNAMTVSWGHFGAIWGHNSGNPTAIVYVRPQRYTYEFTEKNDLFTLSVFPTEYKKQLAYLGSHSGRNENKIATSGLTPTFENGTVFFKEAKNVFVCKKIYASEIKESCFIDKSIINEHYPKKDFHKVYVGEIIKSFKK